jgi:hypothetical protein
MAIKINYYSMSLANDRIVATARFSGRAGLRPGRHLGMEGMRAGQAASSLGITPMWLRPSPRRVAAPDVTDRAGRAAEYGVTAGRAHALAGDT